MAERQPNQVAARIIDQVRVVKTSNPQVAALRLETRNGVEVFAISRKGMTEMGNYLLKAASAMEPEGQAETAQ